MRIITIVLLSLSLNTLTAGEMQLYRITNPDRETVSMIERSGGRVSRYFPDSFAEVYLDDKLAADLQRDGIAIHELEHVTEAAPDWSGQTEIPETYHTYEAVSNILDSLAGEYAALCRVYSLGKTVGGREIWALKISDNPEMEEAEPEVKFVGAIHGNEALSQEMMLYFIDFTLSSYTTTDRIQKLVDSTEIWVVPNMNFDGTFLGQRFNANGVDLNRDFPDREFDLESDTTGREPETRALMHWTKNHSFVLSAGFHSGALVVNYPWDKNLDGSGYAATPDDATFRCISLAYARNNPSMSMSTTFDQGITNGADWYETSGSMQDWNYYWHGCMDVTVELSVEKEPPASGLGLIWEENREAMITYLEQVHTGLRGQVFDTETGEPVSARIRIEGNPTAVYSDPDHGDYYRLMEPGIYDLVIEADGYSFTRIDGVIIPAEGYTVRDILLQPVIRYTLNGVVRDSLDNQVLDDVQLSFYQNAVLKETVITTVDGSYAVELPEGIYTVKLIRDGYFQKNDSLHIDRDRIVDFRLTPVIPGRISGTVVLEEREDARGTVIYCQGVTDTVQNNNTFDLSGLQPGRIHLFAHTSSYRTTHTDTFLANGDSLELSLFLYTGSNEYSDDFEAGDGGFIRTEPWAYGTPEGQPGYAHSGDNLWGTGLQNPYESGPLLGSLETPIYSILDLTYPLLEFYHWYDTEELYDGGNVKISTDEGQNWQVLQPNQGYAVPEIPFQYGNPLGGQPGFSGSSDGWDKVEIDLTPYKDTPFVQFRFDFGIDEEKGGVGWFIDDFRIIDGNATYLTETRPESEDDPQEVKIYPNPANPGTTIRLQIRTPEDVELIIFNLLGQKIYSTHLPVQGNQVTSWYWDGSARNGMRVPSGVYLFRMKSGRKIWQSKIVILN